MHPPDPTSIENFDPALFKDPFNNIKSLTEAIEAYHHKYVNNIHMYKAPYTCFVQSSGTGKTMTVLNLRSELKTFYISCRKDDLNVQPTRSFHVFKPLVESFTGKSIDKIVISIRLLLLACLRQAARTEGNFVMSTPNEWSVIMEDFKTLICEPDWTLESSLAALNSNAQFSFESPVLFAFDEARLLIAETFGKIDLFSLILDSIRRCEKLFCLFIDTSPKIAAIPSNRQLYGYGNQLFPVYTQTPFMDVLLKEVEPHMDLCMLSLAHMNLLPSPYVKMSQRHPDPKVSFFLALSQGRPLWYSDFRMHSLDFQYPCLLKFALLKLICAHENTPLDAIDDSAALSLANYKFNVIIPFSHALTEQIVFRNLALCVGISENRQKFSVHSISEPIIIEAIDKNLLYTDQAVKLIVNYVYSLQHYFKNLLLLLTKIMKLKQDYAISTGEVGELTTRVLLVMAHDITCINEKRVHPAVPVPTRAFLNTLLSGPVLDSLEIPENYLEGFTSCSHFIRLCTEEAQPLTSELARLTFRRTAALIVCKNFVGSDLEIPVAYCKNPEDLARWKELISLRYASSREEVDNLDDELDKLTTYAFISVSFTNEIDFTRADAPSIFHLMDPLGTYPNRSGDATVPTVRNSNFLLKDSFNLQILFSLQSILSQISLYSKYRAEGEGGFYCAQVFIEGFDVETFSHWGSSYADLTSCFQQLAMLDQDLEYQKYCKNIDNGDFITPVTYYRSN